MFAVTLNDVDRTQYLSRVDQLGLSWRLTGRTPLRIALVDPAGSWKPLVGQQVALFDTGVRIWAGTIDSIEETNLFEGSAGLRFACECVSLEQRLDKRMVRPGLGFNFVFKNQYAGDIVEYIRYNYLDGEAIQPGGTIEQGALVDKIVFDFVRVSQAFDQLATLSGFTWFVDSENNLNFVPRTTFTAPFAISNATASTHFFGLTTKTTREALRTKQYLRIGVAPNSTQNFTGNGTATSWNVTGIVKDVDSITLNGTEVTFGVKDVDTDKDFYYSPGESTIWQATGGTVLTASDTLAVTYLEYGADVIERSDAAAIAARAAIEAGSGWYENLIENPDVKDVPLAEATCQAELDKAKTVVQTVSYSTDKPGLRVGQLQTFNLTNRATGDFLIESIDARVEKGMFLRYRVTAISGSQFGGWLKVWEKLARDTVGSGKVAAPTSEHEKKATFGLLRSLTVENDLTNHYIARKGGRFRDWTLNAKTPPTGSDAILDIQISTDEGVTWASIFGPTKIVIPAGDSTRIDGTGFLENASINEGNFLRINCLQKGSTVAGRGIEVVVRWQ